MNNHYYDFKEQKLKKEANTKEVYRVIINESL
jgi:hypothetical protein